jgi:predicted RNA-binding Zn ribbon-like protein
MEGNLESFEIRLDGGNLSLNFANTVDGRYEKPLKDHLHSYLDLLTWAHYADAINSSQKRRLLQISRENQEEADQVFKDSIQLREAIYDYIVRLISDDEILPANMLLINQWLSKAYSNLELSQVEDNYVLDWKEENFGLESVLWPIIRSFAELIISDARNRIKQCHNCGWVFVDNSKNKSRRWCSMEICGNQVKAQRYANRNRA